MSFRQQWASTGQRGPLRLSSRGPRPYAQELRPEQLWMPALATQG
jgi:hypothetical protein